MEELNGSVPVHTTLKCKQNLPVSIVGESNIFHYPAAICASPNGPFIQASTVRTVFALCADSPLPVAYIMDHPPVSLPLDFTLTEQRGDPFQPASRRTDSPPVSLLCADDFISLLHGHHIGLLGLSISSAEA